MTDTTEITTQTDPVDLDAIYDEGEVITSPIVSKIYGELSNTKSIRAVFGLSPTELSDDFLLDDIYTFELDKSLAGFPKTLFEKWENLPKPPMQPLPEDILFESSVRQYATYYIASKVCDVLPLIVARTLTDSKAMFQRFDIDLEKISENIKSRLATAKEDLLNQLEEDDRVMTSVSLMGVGKPNYNPVIGEQ